MVGLSPPADFILGALALGGFGCLSTYSTLANELRMLKSGPATVYAVATVGGAQLLCVAVLLGFRALDDDY